MDLGIVATDYNLLDLHFMRTAFAAERYPSSIAFLGANGRPQAFCLRPDGTVLHVFQHEDGPTWTGQAVRGLSGVEKIEYCRYCGYDSVAALTKTDDPHRLHVVAVRENMEYSEFWQFPVEDRLKQYVSGIQSSKWLRQSDRTPEENPWGYVSHCYGQLPESPDIPLVVTRGAWLGALHFLEGDRGRGLGWREIEDERLKLYFDTGTMGTVVHPIGNLIDIVVLAVDGDLASHPPVLATTRDGDLYLISPRTHRSQKIAPPNSVTPNTVTVTRTPAGLWTAAWLDRSSRINIARSTGAGPSGELEFSQSSLLGFTASGITFLPSSAYELSLIGVDLNAGRLTRWDTVELDDYYCWRTTPLNSAHPTLDVEPAVQVELRVVNADGSPATISHGGWDGRIYLSAEQTTEAVLGDTVLTLPAGAQVPVSARSDGHLSVALITRGLATPVLRAWVGTAAGSTGMETRVDGDSRFHAALSDPERTNASSLKGVVPSGRENDAAQAMNRLMSLTVPEKTLRGADVGRRVLSLGDFRPMRIQFDKHLHSGLFDMEPGPTSNSAVGPYQGLKDDIRHAFADLGARISSGAHKLEEVTLDISKDVEHGLDVGLKTLGRTERFVITSVEDACHVVEHVLTAFGGDVAHILKWLKEATSLLKWGRIAATQAVFARFLAVDNITSALSQAVRDLTNGIGGDLQNKATALLPKALDTPDLQAPATQAQKEFNPHPIGKASKVQMSDASGSHSLERNWLWSRLATLGVDVFGTLPSPPKALTEAFPEIPIKMLEIVWDDFTSKLEETATQSPTPTASFSAIVNALSEDLAVAATVGVDVVADRLATLGGDAARMVAGVGGVGLGNLGVIGFVWNEITHGKKLTLAELAAWALAIPATISYEIATRGAAPFGESPDRLNDAGTHLPWFPIKLSEGSTSTFDSSAAASLDTWIATLGAAAAGAGMGWALMSAALDVRLVGAEKTVGPLTDKSKLLGFFRAQGAKTTSGFEMMCGLLVPTLTTLLGMVVSGLEIARLSNEGGDARSPTERKEVQGALAAQMAVVGAHLIVQWGFAGFAGNLTRNDQMGLVVDSVFGAITLAANSVVSGVDKSASQNAIAGGVLDPMPDLLSLLKLPYVVEATGGATQGAKIFLDILCGWAANGFAMADALGD